MTRLFRSRKLLAACAVLLTAGVLQFTGVNPAASQAVLTVHRLLEELYNLATEIVWVTARDEVSTQRSD